jgi:ABC-2 type transport system ATP-binding protein
MNAIEISRLSKTFRGKKFAIVEALRKVSLAIEPGEVFGFLGPNGAGKSTTIKILTGQIRPVSGETRIFGIPSTDPAARRQVGYLPENPAFYDFLSAREYLGFVGRAFAMRAEEIAGASLRVLRLLDLDKAADRPIRGFSKGMVQRLGLAQALLHDPQVYILDEPMSGLDPMGRALVKEIIRDLKRQGKTVFFSTHITADIEALCDRIGIIVKGELRAVESVPDLLSRQLDGYRVRYTDAAGRPQVQQVTTAALREQLDQCLSTGATLDGIDPCRRDLEAYFLEVVEAHDAPA